jgi:hypothetical protein
MHDFLESTGIEKENSGVSTEASWSSLAGLSWNPFHLWTGNPSARCAWLASMTTNV